MENLQENVKRKGKSVGSYSAWTMEESNELLYLMVDGINHGWRDANGVLGKQTVEHKILPALNAKLGCQKNYSQYLSRVKWFKTRYNSFSELMRFSSGFGWDPIKKQFTASDEVWDEYLKSHPTHKHFRTDTFADYDDLRIAIGNGTAVGRNSIGLGDNTDARTYGIENLMFDGLSGTFVPGEDESAYQTPSPGLYSSPSPLPSQGINARVPLESTTQRKRARSFNEGNNSSPTEVDVLDRLSHGIDSFAVDFGAVRNLLEQREKESNIWDAIEETPDLDSHAQYAALDLLNTRAKRIAFWKMSLEKRRDWVIYKMSQ